MSTIFRCPDGKIRVYCKGADTVIMERLGVHDDIVEKTLLHLEEYAAEGLRTLCLAFREVSESEFREWYDVYNTAATTVSGNRADELDKAAELIEHDFTLLGATAIEDKLQDGVPDTIHTLQTAGIKVWVLTGDRQETAINIGMSCKLISEDMTLLIVNEESSEATRNNIQKKLDAIRSQHAGGIEMETLALVIDGKSLTFALEKDMEVMFLDLAVMCKAVVCCRVSPLQKALVVKLVKRHLKSILLAIGDGANDVSMIQAAHIGVGISGMEGLQAARSADVSIAQFRFLRKLLLVHGAWSYQRISKVILYFYYKNTALFITQFWYSFQNAFSGQVIVESWTLSFFNVAFTVLPPFVLGIFDQFVNARLLDRYPQLYQLTQKGVFFRRHNFWSWVGNGFYHSVILYYGSILIYWDDGPLSDGKIAGHWVWGTAMYTAGLVTVLLKAALITNIWTKYTVIAIPGSVGIWFIFLPIYAFVAPKLNISTEYVNTLPIIMSSPRFWLTIVALPAVCLIRDFAWKYAKRMYYPQTYHHVQEIQKYNIQDYRPRYVQSHDFCDLLRLIAIGDSILLRNTDVTRSQNGTIPKGHSQGPPGSAHAQATRIRLLANGRESGARAAGLRYDERARTVRRDDEQSSMMGVRVRSLAGLLRMRLLLVDRVYGIGVNGQSELRNFVSMCMLIIPLPQVIAYFIVHALHGTHHFCVF
jgi:phospholipid-transporting ATPase